MPDAPDRHRHLADLGLDDLTEDDLRALEHLASEHDIDLDRLTERDLDRLAGLPEPGRVRPYRAGGAPADPATAMPAADSASTSWIDLRGVNGDDPHGALSGGGLNGGGPDGHPRPRPTGARHAGPVEELPDPGPTGGTWGDWSPPAAEHDVEQTASWMASDLKRHEGPPPFRPERRPAAPGRSDLLTADTVLRRRRAKPESGLKRGIYLATAGRLNLGPSRRDRRRAALLRLARTPLADCHRLAVISLKGGVGKTTTTAALGATLAELRGDRVIAVDANPDRGTLAERAPRQSEATVRDLLAHRDDIRRYADVRGFTSQSPTRLEVLASDVDPSASLAFSEQDYRDTVDVLERFYNLILTDCGTGLLHDAMRGVLGLASSLIVVSSASLDGARSASATLDWLEAHGFEDLAREAVVVISSVRPGGGSVDVIRLEDHFAERCRDVVSVPYDPHLEAGGVLDLVALHPDTRDAYQRLAAVVGEGFATA